MLGFAIAVLSVSSTSFPHQKDTRVEIYDCRYFTHSTFTRIVVDIGTLREYSPHELPSPDRIFVDIYQAKLNPILHNKTYLVKNEGKMIHHPAAREGVGYEFVGLPD